jgi:hypothetical protein
MPINIILGLSMVTLAAAGPMPDRPDAVRLSSTEKAAAVQRVINNATDCVIREIRAARSADNLGDQIAAVMPFCAETMRAMIESFDANYGEGSGETFFSGSFLDLLPQVVSRKLAED